MAMSSVSFRKQERTTCTRADDTLPNSLWTTTCHDLIRARFGNIRRRYEGRESESAFRSSARGTHALHSDRRSPQAGLAQPRVRPSGKARRPERSSGRLRPRTFGHPGAKTVEHRETSQGLRLQIQSLAAKPIYGTDVHVHPARWVSSIEHDRIPRT